MGELYIFVVFGFYFGYSRDRLVVEFGGVEKVSCGFRIIVVRFLML